MLYGIPHTWAQRAASLKGLLYPCLNQRVSRCIIYTPLSYYCRVFGYQRYVNNSYLGRSDPISCRPSLRGAACLQTHGSRYLCEHPGHPGRSPRAWQCRCRFQHQRRLRGPGALHPPFPPPTARAGPSRKDFPRARHGHRHRPAPSPASHAAAGVPVGVSGAEAAHPPLVSCPPHPLGYSPASE